MKEQMEAAKAAKVPEILRKRFNVRTVAPLFGVIFVTLLFAILTKGSILKLSNIEVIINQAVFTILAGTGAVFVYAYGGIDLSIGALQGICSLVVVLLLRAGCPAPLTLVASIATGLLSGLLTGGLSVWLGIAVFITSLCMNFIMRGILQTVTATAMMYIPPEFAATDNWTLKVIVLLIVLAIGFYVFNFTRVGKYERAIGGNPKAAELAGVNTRKYRILAHVLLGGAVGVVGFFAAARGGAVYPQSGSGFEMDVLIALVLGGLSLSGGASCKLRCAVIGALTIAVMSNGFILLGAPQNAIEGIKGFIFIAVVALSYERTRGQVIK